MCYGQQNGLARQEKVRQSAYFLRRSAKNTKKKTALYFKGGWMQWMTNIFGILTIEVGVEG
jgi:hypothetical protein